jgi:hypothetical protein
MFDDHDSLFVVTGTIKSDSWGLAAYEDPMDNPGGVLKLSRIDGDEIGSIRLQKYHWVSRGVAEARVGANSGKMGEKSRGKDQTLFLRGYTLAFSQDFRNQRNALLQVNLEHDFDDLSSKDGHSIAGGSQRNTIGFTDSLGATSSADGAADSPPYGDHFSTTVRQSESELLLGRDR